MPTFVPDEVVTAAKMNLIFRPVSASNTGNRTVHEYDVPRFGCVDGWGRFGYSRGSVDDHRDRRHSDYLEYCSAHFCWYGHSRLPGVRSYNGCC